ncbi:MAG TPA: hypothetical protein VFX28_19695 [Methylomirabilota bacterium]|nr:hypothetical protein [Methylomirabilota bacterium]
MSGARRALLLAGVALGSLAAARGAGAQEPADLVARGVQAYQDLEFDVAAGLLRRALDTRGDALASADRRRALTYLAAVERYRGHGDSAVAVFRRLVVLDPRHRPDPLVFPPEVTTLFERVRRELKVVAVAVPADTLIAWQGGQLTVRLLASSAHTIRATVVSEQGRLLRTLYVGPIADSLVARWDVRDSAGHAPTGRVWLTIDSEGGETAIAHVVRIPLDVDLSGIDTLPHPPPLPQSELLPERTSRGTATRALAGGVLLGAAAIALPTAISPDGTPSGGRFAVAGALGLAGLVGYVTQPPGRSIPGNVALNQARRAEWQRRHATVLRENAERLRTARWRVRAGTAAVLERGAT